MKLGDAILGAVLIGGGVTTVWFAARPRAKARAARPEVVCPARPRADTSDLRAGDFVALTLCRGKLRAVTWARVEALEAGRIHARLVGEFGAVGVRALPAKIGFRLGDGVDVAGECVFEVYRPAAAGIVLCGQWLRDVSGSGPVGSSSAAPGDAVQIWLAPADPANPQQPGPGFDVHDPVWAEVLRVSSAGHVLRVRVLDVPTNTAGHKVSQGALFDITRECVAGFRKKA